MLHRGEATAVCHEQSFIRTWTVTRGVSSAPCRSHWTASSTRWRRDRR